MKKFILALAFVPSILFSQEALKSSEEEYYDFLSLQGKTVRPALNYRTLSDSEWQIVQDEDGNSAEHVWQENNLGRKFVLFDAQDKSGNFFLSGVNQSIALKFFGPEWFNSYNTAYPYGQNDGALWQGKGYNTSLTGGIRLEAYGAEITFKPQVSFSQNKSFDFLPGVYGSEYSYFWGYGVDLVQRFGDSSYWTYDWGDTEIRYTWKNLTAGFGTQAIWLGPAFLNPMLGSNNAATYPKVDVGLRRTQVYLPWLGWYIGDIEGRVWTGYLSQSEYFVDETSDGHNFIHGLAMAYAPSFLPGFTIGLNRVCLVHASKKNLKFVFPMAENTDVGVAGSGEDQKFSLTLDYLFPSVGFEIYGEIGTDDYAPGGGMKGYLRYLTHTMTYTVGAKKEMTLSKNKNIHGEIIFEWNNTEMSQNYQLSGGYSFGFHNQIVQGYTNKGQWIGSGIGYGGNSQYFEYKILYPKGNTSLFIGRNNPDNNYVYSKAINSTTSETAYRYGHSFKANYYFGFSTKYFVTKNLSLSGGTLFNLIINPLYNERTNDESSEKDDQIKNWNFQLGLKYNF